MTLGERLIKAREHAGRIAGSPKPLSQEKLAELTGVLQQTISSIETGKTKETAAIVALAVGCGVRPQWLSEEAGPMVPDPDALKRERKIESLTEDFRACLDKVLDGLVASMPWDPLKERRLDRNR